MCLSNTLDEMLLCSRTKLSTRAIVDGRLSLQFRFVKRAVIQRHLQQMLDSGMQSEIINIG